MPTKPFFVAALATLGVGLSIVAAINYTVDISGVYRSSTRGFSAFVESYAERLHESPTGLVKPDISERHIKYALANHYDAECYITGSSHEMGINLARMPDLASRCKSTLNLASSGAGFEDALIMLDAVAERANGKLFVLGIAPWFFKRNTESRWQELGGAYPNARAHLLGARSQTAHAPGKLANLINGQYLYRNLESLFSRTGNAPEGPIASTPTREDAMLGPDGSLTYSQNFIAGTLPRRETTTCFDYKIAQPFVQEQVVAEFEQVLREMAKKGARLALLLTPYHPGVYKCSTLTPTALQVTEDTVRQLGQRLNIPVWGGYDPSRHGMSGDDFYDYMHVDANRLHKIRLP